MTLGSYLKTLYRYWLVLVVLAVLGAGVGYLHATLTPPTYRSTSQVLLTSDVGGSASNIAQSSNYIESIVASYVLLADSETVLAPVIEDLRLDTTPQALANQVQASSPLNTVIIQISVTAGDPVLARDIAVAVTEQLASTVEEVSPSTDGDEAAIRLTTMTTPTVPNFQVSPNKKLETALGGGVGAALGVLLALARRFFGEPLNDVEDMAASTDHPVLGEIVEFHGAGASATDVLTHPRGPQAESLRALVTNLRFLQVDGGVKSLVVTSSLPQEGKSSISVSLAAVLAESGSRVLLVDGDLRNPSVASLTNLDGAVGLSDVLAGEFELASAVQEWIQGVEVLVSGPVPPNPGQLLSSAAMSSLLEAAEEKYDLVIVDSAPLLVASDAVWLGHATAGVLLLARRGKTTNITMEKALDILKAANSRTLGVVLSRVRAGRGGRYSRYGTYGQ